MATKVSINIGPFLNAPARILTAVRETTDTDLRTVCEGKKDGPSHAPAKVNQLYRCTHVDPAGKPCGREERSYHPYPRGQENPDGTYKVLPPDALAGLEADDTMKKTLSFLPAPRAEVDQAVPYGKFYYVGPDQMPQSYAIARDLIAATQHEVGWVTQWAYRTAPSTVRAVVMGEGPNALLGIQQIATLDQVVAPPQLNLPEYPAQYLEMALQTVPLLMVAFNPTTFGDVRAKKLAELLATVGDTKAASAVAAPAEAADGMLLSIQQFLAEKAAEAPAAKKPARKRAPRKTTEKVSA